ncbi:MAG TPA: APC family permease [Ferroplasma sp.]|nr:APC family permease [Ferroplasma sp.]
MILRINKSSGDLKSNVHRFIDLSALSTSSVAPAFSIAASYGVIVMYLGFYSIMAIILTFPVWLGPAIIFRKFNRLYPSAGASYHWGNRIVSRRYGSMQAWVITLAYFFSIPPIVIPAGEYTAVLLYNTGIINYATYNNATTIFIIGSAWISITLIASIMGAKPTARLTEIFLVLELSIIVVFVVIAIYFLPGHTVNPVSYSWFIGFGQILKSPYKFMIAFPVIATIMDGWEIDSYASEESFNREKWPGTTGIIGLIAVFAIYLVTMTLMDIETPINLLSASLDPLATWSQYMIPKYSFIMDIAVIASTASSLWLTTYILSRAWYAMSREKLFPRQFGYINRERKSPYANLLMIGIAAESINAVMLFVPSIEGFFAELLSISGIFLMMEFGIDAFTGIYLYSRRRQISRKHMYLAVSIFSFTGFSIMILFGLITDTIFLILFIIMMIPAIMMLYTNKN